jgi:hypothetical protein
MGFGVAIELCMCTIIVRKSYKKKLEKGISVRYRNSIKDGDDVGLNVGSLELRIYRLLMDNNLETLFPNTFIAYCIYLSLMISNCSGERSFSVLKRIKNQVGSCMTQTRLNSLTLLSVEHELLQKMDFTESIKDFASQKSRKQNIV